MTIAQEREFDQLAEKLLDSAYGYAYESDEGVSREENEREMKELKENLSKGSSKEKFSKAKKAYRRFVKQLKSPDKSTRVFAKMKLGLAISLLVAAIIGIASKINDEKIKKSMKGQATQLAKAVHSGNFEDADKILEAVDTSWLDNM